MLLLAGPVLATGPAYLAHGGGALPPFTAASIVGLEFSFGTVLVLAAVALYGWGVRTLRARGDSWSGWRSCWFGVGCAVLALATSSGLAVYDTTLLSVHMAQHMLLSMVGPIFLALGAPVTLALRVLSGRPRASLLAVLHSRVVRGLSHPLIAFALFVASPFVLYFTGLYEVTLTSVVVHEMVHVHFVLVGCMFFWPLIGLDPMPWRWPYPARGLLMFLATPFHAVLGLTIMQSHSLIAGSYYSGLDLSWTRPAADQVLAGGILWAGGELVSVLMLGALIVQWMRASEREAVRVDRALDRADLDRAGTDRADPAEVLA